jgi:hypothetical protein
MDNYSMTASGYCLDVLKKDNQVTLTTSILIIDNIKYLPFTTTHFLYDCRSDEEAGYSD